MGPTLPQAAVPVAGRGTLPFLPCHARVQTRKAVPELLPPGTGPAILAFLSSKVTRFRICLPGGQVGRESHALQSARGPGRGLDPPHELGSGREARKAPVCHPDGRQRAPGRRGSPEFPPGTTRSHGRALRGPPPPRLSLPGHIVGQGPQPCLSFLTRKGHSKSVTPKAV